MKKNLWFAALVGVALTGCVNEESLSLEEPKQQMMFDAPLLKTQSRANVLGEINGIKYPSEENFKVFCKRYTGNFPGWDNDNAIDYFAENGEEAKHGFNNGGTSAYWVTDNVHYWPDAPYNLAFAAYSPSDFIPKKKSGTDFVAVDGYSDVSGINVSYGATGLKIDDFCVQGKADNQYDLLYSDRVVDLNKANHASAAVPLTFRHALSSIVFSSQKASDDVVYKITKLKVSGSFSTVGDFDQGINETDPSLSNAGWNITDGTTEISYVPTFEQFDVPSSAPAQFTSGTSALLMLPQPVDDDFYIEVTYTKNSLESTAKIYLKDFKTEAVTGNPSHTVDSWEMGKRYVYRIAFGKNTRIYFEPSLEDWKQYPTLIYTIK